MSEIEPVPSTRKPILPVLGAVIAVLALAVTVAYVGRGADEPKKLRLASGSPAVSRDAALAPGTGGTAAGGGYTLVGTLPEGQPDDAPVWDLAKGRAAEEQVAALAKALKAGTAERVEGGWRAGGLFVADTAGMPWYFAPCATDQPLGPDVRVGCASASGTAVAPAPADAPVASPGTGSTPKAVAPPPSPAPEPDPVPAATVKAASAPVFQALGLDPATAKVQSWPYGGAATGAHTAGGLTAAGGETRVDVDRDGKVTNANGFLGDATRGDSYPLVSAQEAFEALPPMGERLMLCPTDKDGNGCGEVPPTEITGAHLGLMLQTIDNKDLALVPAWLFEVKGWEQPLPVVAVEPAYIAEPEPAKDDPAPMPVEPSSGSGGGASGDPGQTEPGTPGQVDPAPPAKPVPSPAPHEGRVAVSFTEAFRTARADQVTVRYYEDGCGWQHVTHAVKESADNVVVLLEADQRPADQVCTEIAKAVDVVVDLQAALGHRTLTDGATGNTVSVSSGG
jgi:hypothetical protein